MMRVRNADVSRTLSVRTVVASIVFIDRYEEDGRSGALAAPHARFDRRKRHPLGYANYQFDVARCE